MRTAPLEAPYQVLLLAGQSSSRLPRRLRDTLRARARDLGLDPDTHFRFANAREAPVLRRNAPWVTVYFGGAPRITTHDALVHDLLHDGRFVLPVVRSLADYPAKVPPALAPINGMLLRAEDRDLEDVAARVLEEFRLVRSSRRVFVSYRRTESRAAALQLFHRLEERGFTPFLDTHRVPTGTAFQAVLMDELANVDVVVFLDTPDARTSQWVREELERAGHLGIGMVQLVWPGHIRGPESDLAVPVLLDRADFSTPAPASLNAQSEFVPDALEAIVTHIERVRARNLAARRARLVETFCKTASDQKVPFTHHPGSYIDLQRAGGHTRVIPVLGHPRSVHFEQAHAARGRSRSLRMVLLHDTLGALPRRLQHLRWLSSYLPVQTLAGCEAARWLRRK